MEKTLLPYFTPNIIPLLAANLNSKVRYQYKLDYRFFINFRITILETNASLITRP